MKRKGRVLMPHQKKEKLIERMLLRVSFFLSVWGSSFLRCTQEGVFFFILQRLLYRLISR